MNFLSDLELLYHYILIPFSLVAFKIDLNIKENSKLSKLMELNEDKSVKPQYLHIYPFRFVQPYPHTYRTFTKGRWLGKELLATLVRQFKAFPPEYYQESIAKGLITVNGKQVSPAYGLKNGDQIIHTSIRIEPPILDLTIEIVHESEDFVIVNKPPSVIVHTGGGQHFNTVESLLKYEYGFKNLHVLHRLDKCTSGLLIFAKDKKQVGQFHEESENQTMKKMYFARVAGRIEWNQKDLATHIQCLSHKDGVYRAFDEIQNWKVNHPDKPIQKEVGKEEPIQEKGNEEKKDKTAVDKKKKANNEVKDNRDVKDSRTLFKKIWYDEETDSTLLECYPVTGRTHQIRVHLQFLRHPILNDTAYGGRFVGNGIIGQIDKRWSEGQEGQQPMKKVKPSEQLKPESWDYETRAWEIMLHSYRYKFGGKEFTTKLPYWFKKEAIAPLSKKVESDK